MAIQASIGQSQAIDGRQAASEATHQALDQLGRVPAVAGLIFASYDYPVQQVLNGAMNLLGNIPLIGLSTSATLTTTGLCERSVVVVLLAGVELQTHGGWWPALTQNRLVEDPSQAVQKMVKGLNLERAGGILLIVGDGLGAKAERTAETLTEVLFNGNRTGSPTLNLKVTGCLAEGDLFHGRTYQIGGQQAGSGGVAGLLISGKLSIGVSSAHGWQQVGKYYKITRANGPWLRRLDDIPAAEVYSELLGYSAREWAFPPLQQIVRLYPLGIEQGKGPAIENLMIRSALRMENDGSLRMNASIPEGRIAHFLIGNGSACLLAARTAARQALTAFRMGGKAQPALALVFVDTACRRLLQSQPGGEMQAISEVLGEHVPLAGAYTLGQYIPSIDNTQIDFVNQHITVLLIGERTL